MRTTHISAISAAIAAAMISYAPATLAAPSDVLTYDVESVIGPTCYIPAAPSAALGFTDSWNSAAGTGTGAFLFGDSTNTGAVAVDDTTALVTAVPIAVTYAGAWCNYAANYSLASTLGSMKPDVPTAIVTAAAPGGFTKEVGYTATLDFCSGTATLSATGAVAKAVVACTTPIIDDLVLTVTPIATTTPLVAGRYVDTLTMQIGAAL